jgi:hypothetical protein
VNVEQIRAAVEPLRQALLGHPLYEDLHSPAALRVFMEHHVFAVWDFMSLLKALQQRLCDANVPWLPPADAATARLINEIVVGEETDDDGRGGYASHFELYHRAMRGFGASTAAIDRLLERLVAGNSLEAAFQAANVGGAVREFVRMTFNVIQSNELPRIASAFTFGREDLLPDVFQKIVDRLDRQTDGALAEFQYYLERHIDLDGDRHGPMSLRLIAGCCGNDPRKWSAAQETAVAVLSSRLDLWNVVHRAVRECA